MKRNQILPYRGLSTLAIITGNPLPNGQEGSPYSVTLSATGGQGNYNWKLLEDYGGSGLTLAANGVFSGTLAAAGLLQWVVQVSDGVESVQKMFYAQVANATVLQITTSSPLPSGTVGVSYSQNINAVGGTPPYTWSEYSAPAQTNTYNVSQTGNTGLVTGTPTATEVDAVYVQVVDSLGAIAQKTFQITISAAAVVNPIGINFAAGGVSALEYEGLPIFKNRVREGRGFAISGTNTLLTVANGNLSAAGWPLVDFELLLYTGPLTNNPWYVGTWSCGFTSTASSPVVSGVNGTNLLSGPTNVGGNNWLFTLSTSSPTMGFTISNITAAGGATNLFCYLPEYNSLTTIDNPLSSAAYTPEAIAAYGQFGHIRTMFWSNAAFNTALNTSVTRNTAFNTQSHKGWSGNSASTEGYPIEWMQAFCIACGTGMWCNLPVYEDGPQNNAGTYSQAYLNALAPMVATGKPIYFEIGNELWNGTYPVGFTGTPGSGTLSALAIANGFPSTFTGSMQYLGSKLHALANMVRATYPGLLGNQINIVFASQLGQITGYATEVCAYMIAQGWSPAADIGYFAPAPYINLVTTGADNSISAVIADLQGQTASYPYGATHLMEHCSVLAQDYGIKGMCSYEGGWYPPSDMTQMSISASITGTLLTVNANVSSPFAFAAGSTISGTGVTGGTQLLSIATGNGYSSGSQWQLNASSNVSNELMLVTPQAAPFAGPAIINSSLKTWYENFYHSLMDSGLLVITHFESGIQFGNPSVTDYIPNAQWANTFLTPGNPVAGTPIITALAALSAGGYTPQRNVVTIPGSVVTAAWDNVPSTFTNSSSNITGYACAWQVWSATARTASLVVNATAAGTQTLKSNGVIITATLALINGNSAPVLVPLNVGFNYVLIGKNSYYGGTVNSLTFN